MRTTLRLTVASTAAAALVAAAAAATAQPLDAAPAAPVAETGSAVIDSVDNAARSAVWLAQQGNIIGVLVLLVATPLNALTGGFCDLASGSGLPSPCTAGLR
ncbi:hypothetical protein [Nocardia sp. NPDC048505]|uniref:hypothetical protein n=1 Tax=unclassified Nocardia TaxID=2637762 RepID=UPI0033D6AD91